MALTSPLDVIEILNQAGHDSILHDVVNGYGVSGGLLQTIAHHVHRIIQENGYEIAPKDMIYKGRHPQEEPRYNSNGRKTNVPPVTQTAAGPMCTKCERGRGVWLAADESPCSC